MSRFEFFDSKKETFEQFVSKHIGVCGEDKFTSEALKGLVNEDFDNILYCNKGTKNIRGYEIEIRNKQNGYYEFFTQPIPKKFNLKFGCELETCFILNCKSNNEKEINEILEGKITDYFPSDKWQSLIHYHLKINIIPYLTSEFLNLFTFAFIYSGYHSQQGLFVDLRSGKIIDRNMRDNESYRTLIFEQDGSIKCDKSKIKDNSSLNEYESINISCEIVTPILDKIDDLKILYEGLLIRNEGIPCNQSNSSMGFHVNVSATNDKNETLKLTKGMMMELIYDCLSYEQKKYRALRGEGSNYATKIQDYYSDIDDIFKNIENIKFRNDEDLNNSELYKPYGLAMSYVLNIFNSEKFLTMTHHKQNNVVEFRIFNTSTDIDRLLSYTQDALNIFNNALTRYCETPEETLVQIQTRNLSYKFIPFKIPIPYIEFYGYYDLQSYLNTREGKMELIYYDTSSFFGFRKRRMYYSSIFSIWNIVVEKIYNFNMVIKYNNPDTNATSYYVYKVKYDESKHNFITSDPFQISREEFLVL